MPLTPEAIDHPPQREPQAGDDCIVMEIDAACKWAAFLFGEVAMIRLTKQDIIIIAVCLVVTIGYPAVMWMVIKMMGG